MEFDGQIGGHLEYLDYSGIFFWQTTSLQAWPDAMIKLSCKCKKGCTRNCSCKGRNVPCYIACGCMGAENKCANTRIRNIVESDDAE